MQGYYGSYVKAGATVRETGFDPVEGALNLGGGIVRWASGADAKAERSAKYNLEAARAAERTAALQLQALQSAGAMATAPAPGAGALAFLQKPTPYVPILPIWASGAIALVGLYLLWKR